jgi:hypothetical protein
VFLLGIWTEGLSHLRRQARLLCRPYAPLMQTFIMCLLYAAQLMFGYFCMLVAMTYQVELFVCVVLGLGAGHAAFNFKAAQVLPGGKLSEAEKILRAAADLDDVVDPCCQYLSLDEDSDHSSRPVAGSTGAGAGAGAGQQQKVRLGGAFVPVVHAVLCVPRCMVLMFPYIRYDFLLFSRRPARTEPLGPILCTEQRINEGAGA